jgi:hypothetical protein
VNDGANFNASNLKNPKTVDGNIKARNFGNVLTDFFNKIKTTSAAAATHIVFSAL